MPARLSWPAALFAAAAVFKSVDFTIRWSTAVATLWVLAAALCALHERWGAAAVSALSWWAVLFGIYNNHVVLLAWLTLTFVLFAEDGRRRFIVRWQLTILYGFAAVSKLHAGWLSGEALLGRGFSVPMIELVAWGTVLVEAFLAVALWRSTWRRFVLSVGLLVHMSFLAISGSTPWRVGLVVFGLLAFGMLWWSTQPRPTETSSYAAVPDGSTASRRSTPGTRGASGHRSSREW